jgi:hypothetical protein
MKRIFILLIVFTKTIAVAQSNSFELIMEPLNIPNAPGLQSYAYATYGGKWLVLGGRLDGLHKRQPNSAFDIPGHNTNIYVIDPVQQTVKFASLNSLPASIKEQLSSANMQFAQIGNLLYVTGGYGYSQTAADHITYPYLTVIEADSVINAIENNTSITSYFHQVADQNLAVAGGRMEHLYGVFYLVGGHRFDGRYNPMGHNTFTQTYTNQVRKFKVNRSGSVFSVAHLNSYTDTTELHRRDYNLSPQVFPDGKLGFTAFSGVFQKTVDLPYLNSVDIDTNGYSVNNNFSQYLNHYHCANFSAYDSISNKMHVVFFGGIAQYFLDGNGVLTQDNNVPFVNTIARITRNASGSMAETKLPVEMPALLGSGSEFIRNESLIQYENHVLKLHELPVGDTTLAGYIYGGISSTAPNVFFSNDPEPSIATNNIFKVYLIKTEEVNTIADRNTIKGTGLSMQVYPNPSNGNLFVKYRLQKIEPVVVVVFDVSGKELIKQNFDNTAEGENFLEFNISENGVYFIQLQTRDEKVLQKIILND